MAAQQVRRRPRDPGVSFDGVLYWFRRPDPDEDRCSYCRALIRDTEDEGPESGPAVILWKGTGRATLEARLHPRCVEQLVATGRFQIRPAATEGSPHHG